MKNGLTGTFRKDFYKGIAIIICPLYLMGCTIGLSITRKDQALTSLTAIEYRLGSEAGLTADEAKLKKDACDNLKYATEGLPEPSRQDIFKYSCIEPNKYALGSTLEKLTPEQRKVIYERLAEKGIVVTEDLKALTMNQQSVVSVIAAIAITALIAIK
jgi:hypothetical protein